MAVVKHSARVAAERVGGSREGQLRANAGVVHANILMPGGRKVSLILQKVETIHLTKSSRAPVSVVQLIKDDKVLGYTEEGDRRFGFKIKETISKKILAG